MELTKRQAAVRRMADPNQPKRKRVCRTCAGRGTEVVTQLEVHRWDGTTRMQKYRVIAEERWWERRKYLITCRDCDGKKHRLVK